MSDAHRHKSPGHARHAHHMVGAKPYVPPPASQHRLGPIYQVVQSDATTRLYSDHDAARLNARIICKLPGGQVYYESQLAVDSDGSVFNKHDKTGQSQTAWSPGGHPVDADVIPYFSVYIPIYTNPRVGLRKGDYAAVIYRDKLAFAVLADVGGSHLGEGSLALHRALGHERVLSRRKNHEYFSNNGIDSGVITVAFPHSGNPRRHTMLTPAEIQATGQRLWHSLLATYIIPELVRDVPRAVEGAFSRTFLGR